jgi:hypothetical protein
MGLKFKNLGETVEEFSFKFKGREYDILTTKYLVECKNIHWARYTQRSDAMKKLTSQLGNGIGHARSINRSYILCTKKTIPPELAWFREWLTENGIHLIEGN